MSRSICPADRKQDIQCYYSGSSCSDTTDTPCSFLQYRSDRMGHTGRTCPGSCSRSSSKGSSVNTDDCAGKAGWESPDSSDNHRERYHYKKDRWNDSQYSSRFVRMFSADTAR